MMPISAATAAGPGHDHDGSQHWSHFPDQAQGHGRSQQPLGTEFHQCVVALQAQDHPRKRAGEADHENRFRANKIDLVDDLFRLERKRKKMDDAAEKKDRHPTQFLDRGNSHAAETGQHIVEFVCLSHQFITAFCSSTDVMVHRVGGLKD